MQYCPYCGCKLDAPLDAGITTCSRCGRIFDSCHRNVVLSAAWLVRREHIIDWDTLQFRSHLIDDDLLFVYHYVVDMGYAHDELIKVIDAELDAAAVA